MQLKITNVYGNYRTKNSKFKPGFGNSFLCEYPDHRFLFDLGWNYSLLTHNLQVLGISPTVIETVIFSHGHRDHTGALGSFLSARKNAPPLHIYLHTAAMGVKAAKKLKFVRINMSLPTIPFDSGNRIVWHYVSSPEQISPFLMVSGEITDRSQKISTSPRLLHRVHGKWEPDPLLDDMTLIFKTTQGLVLLCGCGHAGILNICAHVHRLIPDQPIYAIIGGLHLGGYSVTDIHDLGQKLQSEYHTPLLYLNHCTGDQGLTNLQTCYPKEKLARCFLGDPLLFEIL